jgi:hypothetical protein
MEVYVTKNFIEKLCDFENEAYRNRNGQAIEYIERIKRLIFDSNLPIYSNISADVFEETLSEELRRYFLKFTMNEGDSNFSNLIFDSIPNYSGLYFGNIVKDDYGLVNLQNIDNFIYENCTVNSIELPHLDYSNIEKSTPPCNGMLIVDSYLFNDKIKKMESLIKFIELFVPKKLKIPFQLTILSSSEHDKKVVSTESLKSQISELEKIPNINLNVFIDNNLYKSISDRLIFTNYTKGSIGHPFDRKTVFSQNFIPLSNNLKFDFQDYKSTLKGLKKIIDKVPSKIGIYTTKFGKEFNNRIFDVLLEKSE